VSKTATKTPLKPTKTPSTKPVAKPSVQVPESKTAAHGVATTAKPTPKATSRSGHSKIVAQPIPAAPDSQASRFADRFAPARPSRPVAMPEPYRAPVRVDPRLANAWKAKAGRDLTDPELLAMPDSEYMGEKQLEFFRTRLTALKDDLLSNAGETTEHLREDTSIVPDPADRATIEEEHALELRTRDRERKLLKKISQSLARIEAGDYGYCDETGEPIGLARLLARPTATLSLEAQQRREMKQKMFGD
jgi:DnaK suppressor protein